MSTIYLDYRYALRTSWLLLHSPATFYFIVDTKTTQNQEKPNYWVLVECYLGERELNTSDEDKPVASYTVVVTIADSMNSNMPQHLYLANNTTIQSALRSFFESVLQV